MPQMEFGISSYQRGRGDLPELPVINFVAEKAPTEEKGLALQSRPGLSDRSADMGAGPIDTLFKHDNVLSTALFGVSDGSLYSGTTLVGALDGSGPFSISGYSNYVFTAGGASLWKYDGTTLSAISFPDSANVIKCLVAQSRLVALRSGGQAYYYSTALATTITSLNFESAEQQPDRLLDALFHNGILILFGAETVEFHAATTSDTLPFSPMQGSTIERGIKATGCATLFGGTFAWVTDQDQVCISRSDNVISNPGLQKRIAASTNVRLFTFFLDGEEYLALRLDSETQVFGLTSGLWSEFQSYGQTNWIPQCYAAGVFGSATDGKTLEWGTDHQDFGGQIERRFRGGFPLNSGGVTIANVQLRCNVGQTPFLTGDYTDPQIEMRPSRDAGQTWGNWRATNLGAQGQYRTRVQWRACGEASQPGFLAEFRVTDPVDVRISDVLVNEPFGGR